MTQYNLINTESFAIKELSLEEQETIQGGHPAVGLAAGAVAATEYVLGISITGIAIAWVGAKVADAVL